MEVAKDHFWFDWTQYTARRQIAGFIWFHYLRETCSTNSKDSSSDTPDVKRPSWRKFQSRSIFVSFKIINILFLLIYIWDHLSYYIFKGRFVSSSSPPKKNTFPKSIPVDRCLQDMELAYHWAAWKVGEGKMMIFPKGLPKVEDRFCWCSITSIWEVLFPGIFWR